MAQPTVNVFSVDEERLKYRLMVSFDPAAVPQPAGGKGKYTFNLPPPTSFANSDMYDQCAIKLTNFSAYCNGATATPSWNTLAGAGLKNSSVIVRLDVPSSQTVEVTNLAIFTAGAGRAEIGQFRELVDLEIVSVGDSAGNVALAGRTAAWHGRKNNSEPIMCGNPFGMQMTLRLVDPVSNSQCYMGAAGAAAADTGFYVFGFDITMIKKN